MEGTTDKLYLLSVAAGGHKPAGAFGNKIGNTGFQFNLAGFMQYKSEKPLFLGGELVYSQLQRFSESIIIQSGSISEEWNVSTVSQMMYMGGVVRYYLPVKSGTVDFFSEFSLGSTYFFTNTTFTPPGSEEAAESNLEASSFSVRYGACFGLNLLLTKNLYLQTRLAYHAGLAASYYAKKEIIPIIRESTLEAFQRQKTTTDAIKWDIGLTFAF